MDITNLVDLIASDAFLDKLADLVADKVVAKLTASSEPVQLEPNVCAKCNIDGHETTHQQSTERTFVCRQCGGTWTADLSTFRR